jgi:hypothetical protein
LSTSKSIRADAVLARLRRARVPRAAALLPACALPALAQAHGFGLRYDLPLPLSLYLAATAAAIVLSFVVVGVFVRDTPGGRAYPHVDLLRSPRARRIAAHGVAPLVRLAALALALTTLAAGFLGNPDPYRNLAPTLVWIVAWVGLAYLSAFVGNAWTLLNPWRTLADGAMAIIVRVRGRAPAPPCAYPHALGAWPAFALLFMASWMELVYPSPAVPLHIGWMMVAYSAVTWLGMALFGRAAWLAHGEVFSVLYGLLARFAPLEVRVTDPALCASCALHCEPSARACIGCGECARRAGDAQWTLALRPFAAGLVEARPLSTSMTAFVLLVLSSVLYDGVLGTPEWSSVEDTLTALVPLAGDAATIGVRSAGLAAFFAIFYGAFVGVCALMSTASGGERKPLELARQMALTLVPIAIAYHLAHYLVYLLVQGQYVVPLLSDPLGRGADLFGSAGYHVDIGIVGARFAWYAAVTAIVVGHVIAVWLAHRRAMALFASRRAALRAEVPLTALMVAYTFVSLSILAEPITEQQPSAQPVVAAGGTLAVPADALVVQPGSGLAERAGAGRSAQQKLTFRVLGSSFQDGSPMTMADILYAYSFAWRWGTRGGGPAGGHYDPVIDAATAAMRQRLVALRLVGTDSLSKSFRVGDVNIVRELFIVEVYANGTSLDPEQDAALAPPFATLPWHLVALMEAMVERGYAAFSQEDAKARGVPWLDLARSTAQRQQMAALVDAFARDGYRPAALANLVTRDEAVKRWQALAAFYKAHGHFLVTNGPYVLKAWTDDSATLDVFRDLSYPLGVGSFDAYAIPRRGFIVAVAQQGNRLAIDAQIETISRYQRSYDIVREALPKIAAPDLLRAAPQCRYMVLDAQGAPVLVGSADPTPDARFDIDFAGRLAPGDYTVLAQVTVDGNATNAEIRRIPLSIAAASPK